MVLSALTKLALSDILQVNISVSLIDWVGIVKVSIVVKEYHMLGHYLTYKP